MKAILVGIIFTAITTSLLTGCNTTRGVGEDVAATGNAISRAAS